MKFGLDGLRGFVVGRPIGQKPAISFGQILRPLIVF